jgi:hypothetical protein
VAMRSVHRPERWEQHLALLERRSVQQGPEAVRYAVVAHPRPDPWAASAELPGEGHLMVALRPPVVGAAEFESAESRQAAVCLPRMAVSATQARRSAESVASVGQAAALQPEESAAQDAVAVLPRVAGYAGVAPVAAQDAAEAPRQEVEAWVGAAAPRPEAVARVGAAALQPEAAGRDAAEEVARRRVAPGEQVVALPSAAPWVFHRDQAPPWPARSPAAPFARARQWLRIASP